MVAAGKFSFFLFGFFTSGKRFQFAYTTKNDFILKTG
jgi:hypothetical protein